ncbi:unnamed protein product [Larinioides sclopetarius]|uniref:Uncharacterized protein n=1 Tax=Larinioides sclopetarius TaxID=280406 RepID=A0AAV2AUL4_9ARAC
MCCVGNCPRFSDWTIKMGHTRYCNWSLRSNRKGIGCPCCHSSCQIRWSTCRCQWIRNWSFYGWHH